jgi:hypothetical protein
MISTSGATAPTAAPVMSTRDLITSIIEIATEWGFKVEAMRQDLAAGADPQAMHDRLMAEVYGEGGLAGY